MHYFRHMRLDSNEFKTRREDYDEPPTVTHTGKTHGTAPCHKSERLKRSMHHIGDDEKMTSGTGVEAIRRGGHSEKLHLLVNRTFEPDCNSHFAAQHAMVLPRGSALGLLQTHLSPASATHRNNNNTFSSTSYISSHLFTLYVFILLHFVCFRYLWFCPSVLTLARRNARKRFRRPWPQPGAGRAKYKSTFCKILLHTACKIHANISAPSP